MVILSIKHILNFRTIMHYMVISFSINNYTSAQNDCINTALPDQKLFKIQVFHFLLSQNLAFDTN